jgi:hypothetical protein
LEERVFICAEEFICSGVLDTFVDWENSFSEIGLEFICAVVGGKVYIPEKSTYVLTLMPIGLLLPQKITPKKPVKKWVLDYPEPSIT